MQSCPEPGEGLGKMNIKWNRPVSMLVSIICVGIALLSCAQRNHFELPFPIQMFENMVHFPSEAVQFSDNKNLIEELSC